MENQKIVQIGGNVEKAIRGEYQLDVKSILQEAWHYTKQSRLSINLGVLFVMILAGSIGMYLVEYFGGYEQIQQDPQSLSLISLVITLIAWPFLGGVEMMGVFHAIKIKTRPSFVFAFLRRGSWVAICALLVSLLTNIGFSLFIIPGIFVGVSLSLTVPLVIEKKMSPIEAIVTSFRATIHQWFRLFAIYAILVGLLVLASLPLSLFAQSDMHVVGMALFIIALSFLIPFYYNVKGVLYREIFGLKLLATPQDNIRPDDIFSA
ncbi:DUF2189 domain-containing protein [Thalassotalea agarivorans]|uniref:Membrane domain of glycerophosphoryl diester phosphodiesterase n=1 Tax=Thalassotalea agarivorans TaxID=349064 RepID=A0A1I0ETC3_THASX|nr:hypothetical protein [Thalassotalea agarivorans]SET48509.1 hypothetical protein SAMN05660429_01925 [Thalassotalea agarivorans]